MRLAHSTRISLVALALVLAAPASAQAPSKELVAVLDLRGVGASEAEVAGLTNRLREVLLNTGRVTLVDRSQMEAILNEQALQQTGCTSQSCAVQVGQVLGVRNIVSGEVVKISDGLWLVSTLMIDVETSETLRVASVRHRGDYFALMDQRISEIGDKLMGSAPTAAAAVTVAPAAPSAGETVERLDMGSLVEFRFSTEPSGARIYLDGKRLRSETPHSTAGFYTGEHRLLYKKPGYRAVVRTITGNPGVVVLTERLEPIKGAALDLTDAPGELEVTLDGQAAGQTPSAIDALQAGTHRIELRGRGYKLWSKEVTLATGQELALQPDLERVRVALFPGQLSLDPWKRQYPTVIEALRDGLVSAATTALAYTPYPELAERSGAIVIPDADALRSEAWKGFFVKEPDPAFIARKGKELNVDGVLLFDLSVRPDESGSIVIYLYDTASGRSSVRKQSWGRNTAKSNIFLSTLMLVNEFAQTFQ